MKGIVFTEFLDFVGGRYGADMVEDARLSNGGAYTSGGAYPFSDMGALPVPEGEVTRFSISHAAEVMAA